MVAARDQLWQFSCNQLTKSHIEKTKKLNHEISESHEESVHCKNLLLIYSLWQIWSQYFPDKFLLSPSSVAKTLTGTRVGFSLHSRQVRQDRRNSNSSGSAIQLYCCITHKSSHYKPGINEIHIKEERKERFVKFTIIFFCDILCFLSSLA